MAGQPLCLQRADDGVVLCDRLVLGGSFRQRFMGLMGRASLEAGEGLYLDTNSIHMLFMRFPIDALFVSGEDAEEKRRVVGIREQLPPWRGIVLPVRGAAGVVEMPAGTLARLGVEVGDIVVFSPAEAAKAPADRVKAESSES